MTDNRVPGIPLTSQGLLGLRTRLSKDATEARRSDYRLSGLSRDASRRLRHLVPAPLQGAAVLIALQVSALQPTVILTQRATNLRTHPGLLSLPGGRVEHDDSGPVQTALREAREEIGLDPSTVDVLGQLPDHIMVESRYRVTPVVAVIKRQTTLRAAHQEVEAIIELPLEAICNPNCRVKRQRRIGEAEFYVEDIETDGHRVWGGTAGILITLARILRSL